jgi:hypothetical protein
MHIGWLEKGCYSEAPASSYEAAYFDNPTFSNFPKSTRNDGERIDFTWAGSPAASCGVPVDNFSAQWTRTLSVSATGQYQITTTVDGSAKVFVDDTLRHSNASLGAVRTRASNVTLSAGTHTLRVDYADTLGLGRIKVDIVSCDVTVTSASQGATIYAGQSTTLSVTASSESGISYQWYLGASGDQTNPVPNATGSSLTSSPTVSTSYWVRVSTACTNWNSQTITVNVQSCPTLYVQAYPSNVSIREGESALLRAYTSSVLPVSYKWYKGYPGDTRQPLSGSSSILYVAPSDSAVYWVRVSTACTHRDAWFSVNVLKPVTYKVSFRSYYGPFVVAEGGGGAGVRADHWSIHPGTTFDLIDLNGGGLQNGDAIHLRASSGHYLVAEGCGRDTVNANRLTPGNWETFYIRDTSGYAWIGGGSRVGLQTVCGWWVVAEGGGGGEVNANRSSLGAWETFVFVEH